MRSGGCAGGSGWVWRAGPGPHLTGRAADLGRTPHAFLRMALELTRKASDLTDMAPDLARIARNLRRMALHLTRTRRIVGTASRLTRTARDRARTARDRRRTARHEVGTVPRVSSVLKGDGDEPAHHEIRLARALGQGGRRGHQRRPEELCLLQRVRGCVEGQA